MQSGGGGGLARFRSAPATWLDALLEDEDAIKLAGSPNSGGLTQLLTAGSRPTPAYIPPPPQQQQDPATSFFDERESSGQGQSHHHNHVNQNVSFQRMNSSPAEFLSGAVDGYFSGFGGNTSFDFVGSSSTSAAASAAASVDVNVDIVVSPSGKRLRHLDSRGEGQLSAAASGLLDMEMEKLFEDSVPCRVRAKRGCATHPRSIAERVRRTRISDRIRKLQELVPNMDKQTNTADMLEEAVEYVKTLQKQIQDLTEQKKNCTCLEKS